KPTCPAGVCIATRFCDNHPAIKHQNAEGAMLRTVGIVLLCCGAAGPVVARDKNKEAELKWARKVANDFFQAINDGNEAAFGLLSPELAKAVELTELFKLFRGTKKKVVSELVAPDGREVVITGGLKGLIVIGDKLCKNATFTLRVAKESGGRWSIRFFDVKAPTKKK